MKRYIYLLTVCIIAFASCKKSTDGSSNTLMLAEMHTNGILDVSYFYSGDQRLLRMNEYGTFGNQSILEHYVLYEYGNNGLLEKRKVFSANDTMSSYFELLYDNANRIARANWWYVGALYNYRLYEYDQQGNIIKSTLKGGQDNKTQSYTDYTYDQDGRMLSQVLYSLNMDKFIKASETISSPVGKNVYKHWRRLMSNPTDLHITDLHLGTRHFISYSTDGTVLTDYTETGSNQQYNGAGYLVSQTITRTYAKPVKADEVTNKQYTYTN